MKRLTGFNAALVSFSLAAAVFAAPVAAQVSFNLFGAPPAPVHEAMPVLAPGQVWAPGYWGWSGERHVWIRGRPIAQRPGYNWVPDGWEQRGNGYARVAGHWQRQYDNSPGKSAFGHSRGKARGHNKKGF